MPEHSSGACSEDASRRFEIGIDLLDEWRHDQDHEGRRRNQVGEYHARYRSRELEFVQDRSERDAVGDRGHHQREQEEQHQRSLARKIPARKRVSRRDADEERQRDHREHDLDRHP